MQKIDQNLGRPGVWSFIAPESYERDDKMDGTKCAPLVCSQLPTARAANPTRDRGDSRWQYSSFHIHPNLGKCVLAQYDLLVGSLWSAGGWLIVLVSVPTFYLGQIKWDIKEEGKHDLLVAIR